ncbi:MAG: TonB-dependent receptor [Pseudoxanthomonas mexicana]|nr:TonB-dependent receptor [Pseudoxanthomonas mexicana]
MHHRTKQITTTGLASCKALALAVAIAACLPAYVTAAEPAATREAVVNFDIPAGDLSVALERFSTQSGIQAMYRQDLVAGKRAPTVSGALSPAAALTRILSDSGLVFERVNSKTYVLKAAPKQERSESDAQHKRSPEANTTSGSSEAVTDLTKVVVVGSRLGTSPVESALPIRVITREEIDRSNASNVAQALSGLSEVSVNNLGDRSRGLSANVGYDGTINSTSVQLRGLPLGTTLVLINGRRAGESSALGFGGLFDLSTIPLSLVDRIEILTAGASAVYGGDGLAGAVNIVLRKDAEGLELRVGHKSADHYEERFSSLLVGKSWESGSLTAIASWSDSTGLTTGDRDFTADKDYRRFGGLDYRSNLGNPATIYSLAGCPASPRSCSSVPAARRGSLPGLTSPFAIVPGGQNGVDLSPEDFAPTAGQIARYSVDQKIFADEIKKSVSVTVNHEISKHLEMFGEVTYSERSIPAYEVPLEILGANGRVNTRVSAGNPYNPFGVEVGVNYQYGKTGLFRDFSQDYLRALAGLRGRVSKWDWELSGWQSKDRSEISGVLGFDEALVGGALASTNPLTALNPFVGDGSAPASRAVLETLVSSTKGSYSSISRGINGYIKGPVFSTSAGQVTALIGAERSENELRQSSDDPSVPMTLSGTVGNNAVFAETRIPLIASREPDGRARLVATGAYRREWSDRYAEPGDSETLGVEFRPTERLTMRASYSTAFKPPLTYSALQEEQVIVAGVYDPRFEEFVEFPFIGGSGISPGLKPERSATNTLGIIYSMGGSWNASATHWQTRIKDRISYVSPDFFIVNEQSFPDRVVRDQETGRIIFMDGRQINISVANLSGVDLSIENYKALSFGSLVQSVGATYTYKHDEQVTNDAPMTRNVGVIRDAGWAPRWKAIYRASLEVNEIANISLLAKYVSEYRDSATVVDSEGNETYPRLGNFVTLDMNVDMKLSSFEVFKSSILKGSRLNIGVSNIFDKSLDYCASCAYRGYDTGQYDILGRSVNAELRFSF